MTAWKLSERPSEKKKQQQQKKHLTLSTLFNTFQRQAFYLNLKGHSQLCDCADLDTSFSHFEQSLPQPEIKVHLEIRFIFPSGLLDFQSFAEKPVFECPFAHPMILFLSYLVKSSIFRVSGICKLAMEWYVMRMCTS